MMSCCPAQHDIEDGLNPRWVASLSKQSNNWLFAQKTKLENKLKDQIPLIHRTITALALCELLTELQHREKNIQSKHTKALETLLMQPNLSDETRKWVRVELGYDKP